MASPVKLNNNTVEPFVDNWKPSVLSVVFAFTISPIFGEKIKQTQIAVDEAMAELGWLDDATAENGAGATEHTTS